MKTSNYILIALFAFVTVSLLVLFISARGHENGDRFNFIQKEYPLDSVNVIVAEPEVSIHIRQSNENSLTIHYLRDDKVPENPYRVSNDTLFVSKVVCQNGMSPTIEVYVNHLSSFVARNKSNIRIHDFTFNKLEINADQARVNLQNSSIEEVIVQADNSEISMYLTKGTSIFGKLENNSNLRGDSKSISKMDVEKDQNSRISFQ